MRDGSNIMGYLHQARTKDPPFTFERDAERTIIHRRLWGTEYVRPHYDAEKKLREAKDPRLGMLEELKSKMGKKQGSVFSKLAAALTPGPGRGPT